MYWKEKKPGFYDAVEEGIGVSQRPTMYVSSFNKIVLLTQPTRFR